MMIPKRRLFERDEDCCLEDLYVREDGEELGGLFEEDGLERFKRRKLVFGEE